MRTYGHSTKNTAKRVSAAQIVNQRKQLSGAVSALQPPPLKLGNAPIQKKGENDTTISLEQAKEATKGWTAESIQIALNELGYPCGEVDGVIGTATKKAIRAFQKATNIKVDGVAGKNTRAYLYIGQQSNQSQDKKAAPEKQQSPADIYKTYQEGSIDMVALGKQLIPYASSDASGVLDVFEKFDWATKDNLAYAMAANSSNTQLAGFNKSVLNTMSVELNGYLNTQNWKSNWAQAKRVDAILIGAEAEAKKEPLSQEEAKSDLKKKVAKADFPIVEDLLTKSQHKVQGTGSTNCNEVAINMITGYLASKGYDVGEFKIGNQLSTKEHSYHLVREKYESLQGSDDKKKVFEDLGLKNHQKKIWSYKEGLLNKDDEWKQAIQYIGKYLKQGIPVLVGVDHTYSRTLRDKKTTNKNSSYTKATYNEGTTDHWIVVVGSGIDNGQKYLTYFDPGRGSSGKRTEVQGSGANTEWNRLIQSDKKGEEHIWHDKDGAMSGQYGYTLSAVAKFNKDRPELKYQVQKELKRLGYYTGAIDGHIGDGTTAAIIEFEKANGDKGEGKLTSDLLKKLQAAKK